MSSKRIFASVIRNQEGQELLSDTVDAHTCPRGCGSLGSLLQLTACLWERSVGSRLGLQSASWGARFLSGATLHRWVFTGRPESAQTAPLLHYSGQGEPAQPPQPCPPPPLPLASALCVMFVTSTPSALRGRTWRGLLPCREMSRVGEGPGHWEGKH